MSAAKNPKKTNKQQRELIKKKQALKQTTALQQEELAAGKSVCQFVSQSGQSALTLVFRTLEADLFEVGVRRHVKGAQLELGAETLNVQMEHRHLLVSGQATQLHRKLHTDAKRWTKVLEEKELERQAGRKTKTVKCYYMGFVTSLISKVMTKSFMFLGASSLV